MHATEESPGSPPASDGIAQLSMADTAGASLHGSIGWVEGQLAHQWVLVVRKWQNLRPSSEFRVFCAGGRVVGACQRDRFSHFDFLQSQRSTLLNLLTAAYMQQLRPVIGDRVVWDAYIDTNSRVFLVDLAPFHVVTDPLLFSWAELDAAAALADAEVRTLGGNSDAVDCRSTLAASTSAVAAPEMRLVPQNGVTPSANMYHGMPKVCCRCLTCPRRR